MEVGREGKGRERERDLKGNQKRNKILKLVI
jgi:hypothetical protein